MEEEFSGPPMNVVLELVVGLFLCMWAGLAVPGKFLSIHPHSDENRLMSTHNIPSIWAVGDVTNRMNLTPVALMEATCFAKTAFEGQPTKPDHNNVPCVVFWYAFIGLYH